MPINSQALQILELWFGPHSEFLKQKDGLALPQYRQRWFEVDAEFDALCREKSETLLAQIANNELEEWLESPRNWLAYIILCDQMPRNVFRGTRRAFAWDERALAAARHGIHQGLDRTLSRDERNFAYMPFEHSENILDQHTAVGLMTDIHDDAPKEIRNITGNGLRYAQKHRDIIITFGRFPHRNNVLQRTSTAEELDFINKSDGFGQGAKRNDR